MSPNHLPLSVTLKIMILSYGDHLSNPTSVKSCCVLQQGTLTPQKVLVISRKRWLRPNMTEKLFTGTLRINQPTIHLSNNILWAEMVIGRNGYVPKWSWTEMVMGRNNPEPLYNMSRDTRKQTLCICQNIDAKPISVFVFAKSLYFLNLKFQWSSSFL